VFLPKWWCAAIGVAVLLFVQGRTIGAQREPATPGEVINRYFEAVGDAQKSVVTMVKRGELTGDLTFVAPVYVSPAPGEEQHGTFEYSFKAPNLHVYRVRADNGSSVETQGCDGVTAWWITLTGMHRDYKPQPGEDYGCEGASDGVPRALRDTNLKIHLKGKEKLGGETTFVVLGQHPGSEVEETLYFDPQSYLLKCWKTVWPAELLPVGRPYKIERFYADYRDVGGIKVPFRVVEQTPFAMLVTTLKDVKINGPLDDASFAEPGRDANGEHRAKAEAPAVSADQANTMDVTPSDAPEGSGEASDSNLADVHTPNFVLRSVGELKEMIPDLRKLKEAPGQMELSALLRKIGDKTVELAGQMPDLICHEQVVRLEHGSVFPRADFSYLIVARPHGPNQTMIDEFRVDLRTGAKLENTNSTKDLQAAISALELPSVDQQMAAWGPKNALLGRGFAMMWIYFYPRNQEESTFRLLGEEQMDGHKTLVVAFAQKADSNRFPSEFRFGNEPAPIPVLYQGVAWVDASDFRIVRLRTDLLAPLPEIALSRLTADVHFAQTAVAGVGMPVWLPERVVVVNAAREAAHREEHKYSEYRAFRVQTRIVPPKP
jgi:hypothetical protein